MIRTVAARFPALPLPALLVLVSALALPVAAQACGSLVASVCDPDDATGSERRTLTVKVAPPAFAAGDRFPVEERSLLLNPKRYRLPPVDGPWRYYAMDGTVYRVDNATALILEVIRDNRTWRLR